MFLHLHKIFFIAACIMCCYCVFQSVDSRFRCYDEIDTDAVLSLDEDVQLITDEVSGITQHHH